MMSTIQRAARLTLFAGILLFLTGETVRHANGQPVGYISSITENYYEEWERGEYRKALETQKQLMESRPELLNSRIYRYVRWISDRSELRFAIGEVDDAITDLEWVVESNPEPAFLLRLAQRYRDRGRLDDYKETLERAVLENNRWRYHTQEYNLLAIARIAELRGENPKQLLATIYTVLMEQAPTFAPGYSGAGGLSLRHKAYDLAEKYYTSALNLKPNNQEALAGLAECYWKASDPRVQEPLTKLLELNPNSFKGISIQAELLLESGEMDEALEITNRALTVNPHYIPLRSLQTAAYFLNGDSDEMKRIQEDTIQFNPHASGVFRVPGRIASRNYRFEEGVEFQRRALLANPDDNEARTLLALDLLRLGEEDEGRQLLETAFKADPYNVHVYNMLKLLDSLETFAQVERGPFVLRLPSSEKDVIAEDALNLLMEAYETYQEKYDIQLKTPVHIQIFDDHDDFMVRSLGLPGNTGFLGICFGRLVTMDSPSARLKETANWRSVLWHEFVHAITLQKTNNLMPRWLSEGISVYEETQRLPAWGQTMDIQYKTILDLKSPPGLTELERFFTQPKTPQHLMLGYLLAAEFVEFYIDTYGIEAMREALDRIGKGEKANESLAQASDSSVEKIDQTFKKHLGERLSAYRNLPAVQSKPDGASNLLERIFKKTETNERWIERSSPFTDAMREGMKHVSEERWEEAEHALQTAHELFPDYQGEDAPLRQLAQVYERWGKRDRVIETLKRITEWDATALSECRRLLTLLSEDRDWKEIANVADLALGIDPFDTGLRKTLAESYLHSDKSVEALSIVRQLTELDPSRRMEHRLQAIEILIQLKRWNEAKSDTIQLLEEFPHFWDAQRLLLTIVERDDKLN